MATQLADTTQVHKAIAHPARLRILAMLRGGELCVCQLTAVLELAPSTVSAHLADLRRAGLVTERKEGRWVHYELAQTLEAGRLREVLWLQLRGDKQVSNDEAAVQRLRAIAVDELCSMSAHKVRLTLNNATRKRNNQNRDQR